MARTSSADVFKKYQSKKYNKSKALFGEDMPDEDFDHFDETPHGPGKGKKKSQVSNNSRKYQHEGGQSDDYNSEQYTGASGEGSFDFKQQMKEYFTEQGEWEKQHVRNLTEKTKSRYV